MNVSLNNLHNKLRERWNAGLPDLLVRARNFASAAASRVLTGSRADLEQSLREAYTTGYRVGYWEGVRDIVECVVTQDEVQPQPVDIH